MKTKVPNLTNYKYNKSLSEVKVGILNALSNKQFRGMYIDTRDTEFKKNRILNNPGNENDFYLYSFEFIGRSAKYYSWWGKLKLSAEFHIHLDSVSENFTKVSVITYNSEVVTGIRPGLGDNLTPIALCVKEVPASTVEEYQILLLIGEALNEKNMPRIIKPRLI